MESKLSKVSASKNAHHLYINNTHRNKSILAVIEFQLIKVLSEKNKKEIDVKM